MTGPGRAAGSSGGCAEVIKVARTAESPRLTAASTSAVASGSVPARCCGYTVSAHHRSTAYSAAIPPWLPLASHPTAVATVEIRRENRICATGNGAPIPYPSSAVARSSSCALVGPSTHRTYHEGDSHSTSTSTPASSDNTVAHLAAPTDLERATLTPTELT